MFDEIAQCRKCSCNFTFLGFSTSNKLPLKDLRDITGTETFSGSCHFGFRLASTLCMNVTVYDNWHPSAFIHRNVSILWSKPLFERKRGLISNFPLGLWTLNHPWKNNFFFTTSKRKKINSAFYLHRPLFILHSPRFSHLQLDSVQGDLMRSEQTLHKQTLKQLSSSAVILLSFVFNIFFRSCPRSPCLWYLMSLWVSSSG